MLSSGFLPVLRITLTALAASGSILLGAIPALSQITRSQARQVTVMITRPNQNDGDGGSGVLVAREGNRYRVLTNCHVVSRRGEYTLLISGNDQYRVNVP
ncbi:MAG: hypothetical protein ACO3EZ_17175, partial [Prochlorotrichaceae cyanobacterium]